jgi:hypothetical protein
MVKLAVVSCPLNISRYDMESEILLSHVFRGQLVLLGKAQVQADSAGFKHSPMH